MPSTVIVTCEQAVYGSFPFRNQGYDILTHSTGCRPEWLDAFARYCRDLGQPPSEIAPAVDRLLFARKIPAGPWVVALGSAQGCDDRGRPGAWAFHGLFLSSRDYRALGASPFPLRPHLIDRFAAETRLEGGTISVSLTTRPDDGEPDQAMGRWIGRGKRLRRISSDDTFDATERFWSSLSPGTRRKRSVTTWSFRSDTPFHWSCVSHRRRNDEPEIGDRDVWLFSPEDLAVRSPRPSPALIRHRSVKVGVGIGAVVLGIILIRSISRSGESPASGGIGPAIEARVDDAPPHFDSALSRPLYRDVEDSIRERLTDWAERLDSEPLDDRPGLRDEAQRIARSVRYGGPMIQGHWPDGEKTDEARKYAETIVRHASFRTWPEDAAQPENARHVLATLAWCVQSGELANEAERIESVADARRWFDRFVNYLLPPSIPVDLPATGLEDRFPELIEYRLHLSRLMRLR